MTRENDEKWKRAYREEPATVGESVRTSVMRRIREIGPLNAAPEPWFRFYRVAVASACAMGAVSLVLGMFLTKGIRALNEESLYQNPISFNDLTY
jgi:hypothetical protein